MGAIVLHVIDMLATSRKIVGHFRQSSSATNRLHQLQADLNLPQLQLVQDVQTRWNSTFDMLQRLIQQRKPVTLYCAENESITNLTSQQWILAENVMTVLDPFERLTKDLSSGRATISLVLPAVRAMTSVLTSDNIDGFEIGVKSLQM
jgi:zinc finger BED domain-containing protein 4